MTPILMKGGEVARQLKGITDRELAKLIRNLAKNVKEHRIAQGITQQTLAARSNMAISTIWELENARIEDLRLSTITAIAQTLKVDALKLLAPTS